MAATGDRVHPTAGDSWTEGSALLHHSISSHRELRHSFFFACIFDLMIDLDLVLGQKVLLFCKSSDTSKYEQLQ